MVRTCGLIKITGFDGLSRPLEEASSALTDLDGGEIGTVGFDPHDRRGAMF
jgi:hypothetical protein